MFPITSRISHLQRIFCCGASCSRRIIDEMLIISEMRGKYLENRYLPRFFLLIFCTLRMQNMLRENLDLLTK